jgi:signal transduction histidine kinase
VTESHSVRRPRIQIRQIALFVFSMIVPSLVLIGVGVGMIVQQDELADKHLGDQRRLRANDFEHALVARLERVRLNPTAPPAAISGTLVDGRLLWSWDRATSRADPDERFAAALAAAEYEELALGQLAAAESMLRVALTRARTDSDTAYAQLLLARIFVKAKRQADADREYHALLRAAPTSVDRDGIPIALYAAEQLVRTETTGVDRERIVAAVDAALNGSALPPAGFYLLNTIVSRVGEPSLRAKVEHTIANVEHAVTVQRDIQMLLRQWHGSESAWLAHGAPLWLLGIGPSTPDGGRTVVAVPADALAAEVGPAVNGVFEIVPAAAAGEWLGDRFPGLKVRVADASAETRGERRLRRAFYAAALVIVVSMTGFGGYLLLRDVRRETRVAELRSQFVSSVSHELKTPLTAIRMFAETLQLDRADAAARREYLDTIVNETERLTRLLNNVLDFSKIEEGRKGYRREPTALGDVIRTAARAMAYPLGQHGFELRVEIDDTIPLVNVDPDAIEQAVLNLLTNAMKYSGDGRSIALRLCREGDRALISVQDDGIGIPLADQRRIFEKFYRVPSPESTRIPGTGLGLTLVEHIVKGHEGSVRVDSAPGRGSTFVLSLPLPAHTTSVAEVEAVS